MNSDELKAKYADDEYYGEVLAKDGLDHEVYLDGAGTLRWKADPLVSWMVDQMDLNDFWYPDNSKCSPDLARDPVSKNDPRIREMYRKMGYSLWGYWEMFFWEVNNPKAEEWEGESANVD